MATDEYGVFRMSDLVSHTGSSLGCAEETTLIAFSASGFVAYLWTFPGGNFDRNLVPSRDVEF